MYVYNIYIYIYIYIYVCIYICMYVYICICIYIYINIYMYIMCVCIDNMYRPMCVYIHKYRINQALRYGLIFNKQHQSPPTLQSSSCV